MSAADDLLSLTSIIDNQTEDAQVWTILGEKKAKVNWPLLQTIMVCFFVCHCKGLAGQSFKFLVITFIGQQVSIST